MSTIRILIIAENLLVRAGLGALLDEMENCQIVGQTATDDLANQIVYTHPDVLLYDMGWQTNFDASNLTEVIESDLPLVVLTADETQAADVLPTLSVSDAYALLLRDSDTALIQVTIQSVYAGLISFDANLAELINAPKEIISAIDVESLTPREDQVLQLLAKGLTNKAIAIQLDITNHTVKFHVNAIMNKLGAQSRTEAVVKATQAGLIIL